MVESFKNRDVVLESKMAEINQNKNSKQTDQPDVLWRLYFTLEIIAHSAQVLPPYVRVCLNDKSICC